MKTINKVLKTLILVIAYFSSVHAESYKLDTLSFPEDMPPEIGALDFASDGKLYVALRRGDIIVAEPKANPGKFKWKRFATGFHNPCGIYIIKPGHILISQMAELTEVIDHDGDGVADEYIARCIDIGLSGNYHETQAICPDGKGGVYIAAGTASHNGPTFKTPRGEYSKIGRMGRNYSSVKWLGWVMHLSADGKLTPYSSGYRMHNGIERDPNGGIWCGDNQGDWRAGSPIYHVTEDSFAGHPSSLVWDKRLNSFGNPLLYPRVLLDDLWNKPAFHLPHGLMRSCAEPIFDTTNGKFGPFAGQMLMPDINGKRIIRCMPEMVDGAYQGAATLFYSNNSMRHGNNRLTFSPTGDTLYIGQTGRGWGKLSEGIQRLKFNGKVPFDLLDCNLTEKGFKLTFTKAIKQNIKPVFEISEYRYAYGYQYGGRAIDRQKVNTTKLKLDEEDHRIVYLELDRLNANHIYDINILKAVANSSESINKKLVIYTLNRLKRPKTENKVTIQNIDNNKLRVEVNGKLFTEYIYKGLTKPILYPIHNPAGKRMTRDYPLKKGTRGESPDHVHHQSLFIGHQGMNSVNTWHVDKKYGKIGKVEHTKLIEVRSGEDRALFKTLNTWKGPNGKAIASDTREMSFSVVDGAYIMDLELNLHASHGDLKFEPWKDGFVAIRTHPDLRLKANPKAGVKEVFGQAENSEGVTGKKIWGKRANWVHYWGKVEGADAGIAIMIHPNNPRTPGWWHARDYGLISANPFAPKKIGGDGEVILKSGETLTLRYRFVFHSKEKSNINIAEEFNHYKNKALVKRTKVLPIPKMSQK